MAAVTSFVRKYLSLGDVTKLRKRGFTVTDTRITGGTDGLLSKLLPGGYTQMLKLKKLAIR